MTKLTGFELKLKRVSARIKQLELARRLGVSPTTLSLIENGWREASPELVERILAALSSMAEERGTATEVVLEPHRENLENLA